MRFLVTLALDAPDDADPQGIKEKVAMDFEKYGGVHVVKVERVDEQNDLLGEYANEKAALKAECYDLRCKLAGAEETLGRTRSVVASMQGKLACANDEIVRLKERLG